MQRVRWPVMIGIVLVAAVIGMIVYLSGGRYESTDDSEVKGARVMISSSLSGRVATVKVREGQFVHTGDVLFQLDGRPLQTTLEEAQANLASERVQVEGLKATYLQRQAEVKAAQDDLAYLDGEARRQKALVAAGTATAAQLASAQSQADQARQKVAAAQQAAANALAALGGDANAPVEAHPLVLSAKAKVDRAALDKSYVDIIAPQDGIVTKVEDLQVGEYINASSPVFSLVSPHLWLEANFKENQLEYMRPGQKASVKIDTYPDRRFEARVDSIGPGTGSSFSLLPPENATGNWVKVTQRVPVTLSFVGDLEVPLRAGLSATVKVDTTHRRALFGHSAQAATRP
jgi:membrane fusion protein (multidrug efflux system)